MVTDIGIIYMFWYYNAYESFIGSWDDTIAWVIYN